MSNSTPTTLRLRLKTVCLALTLLALPLAVSAAGLGKVTVFSALGQPLRAEVDITASREELTSLSARIATPTAFKQAGIEYSPALTGIRLVIEKRPDGQPYLSMVSDRPFNDPFLDLLVELDWTSGRLVREYTFLLDPPESFQKKPVAATAAAVPEVKREAPAAVAAPVPAPSVPAPTTGTEGAPSGDRQAPASRPDMKVVRGTDGVQRIVKAEPTQEKLAKAVETRQVKQGDTLNQIASETKPEGVSLDQMLVALFLGNRSAFVDNVNRLKAGKILAIPDRDTVAAVDPAEARTTIRAHAADFNAYRRKLAAAAAGASVQKAEEPQRTASGKIQAKVEDKLPAPLPGGDKLEVSRSEKASTAPGQAGAGRIAAIEETLVAREKALKEANSRIAELEKNLQDLKKLVELKSQSMADLQKQAQPAQPAVAVAEVKKPAATAPETVKPAAQPAPPLPAPAAPSVQPSVKKPQAAPPPSQPEPSFIQQSPEIVYGGGAILALLLGYLGYTRWRKQRQAGDDAQAGASTGTSGLADSSISGISGGQRVDTDDLLLPTDFTTQSRLDGSAGNAGVDPVAEADVYMAYGRDAQAEEILIDARKSDPTRAAIPLKLLEIYLARKNSKQFETVAIELHSQTGGVGSDWEKAAQLGRQIDPGNPLYGGKMETALEPASADAMLQVPVEQESGAGLESLAEEKAVEGEMRAPIEMPQVHEDFPESLDFELDLAAGAQESGPAEPVSGAAQAQFHDETSGSLDIEFDLETSAPAVAEAAVVPSAAQDEPSGSVDLDLDLDIGAAEPLAADTTSAAEPMQLPEDSEEKAEGLDFDFDLGSAKPSETPVLTLPDEGNVIDFDLELPAPAADLPSSELEIGEPIAAPVASSPLDLSSISLDLDESPAPSAAAGLDEAAMQEVATKYELALAYEEMGDKEGARELLQEVINEGNAVQQEAARSKLAQLDR